MSNPKTILSLFTVLLLATTIFATDCAADDQCATCDSGSGKCLKCWPYYALIGGACHQPSGGVPNCEVYYDNDTDKCAICKSGLQNYVDDGSCVPVAILNDSGTTTGGVNFCGSNCRTCKLLSWDVTTIPLNWYTRCLLCKEGFASLKGNGSETCSSGTNANSLIAHCLYEYGTKSYCYQCKEGWVLSADAKTCIAHGATTQVANCVQLDITGAACQVCGAGHPMINNTSCKRGYLVWASALVLLVGSMLFY
jgi:hypothetical protein